MKIPFEPNFKTPPEQHCKEELNKRNAKNIIEGTLPEELRNDKPDLSWEAEQLAKSNGFYLEYSRSHKGPDKHWMFMLRISIPGGGPITREQWLLLDELSEKHTKDSSGFPTLRLTTRENIQFHWVNKAAVLEIVKKLAESGLNSLNGCGDNTRNVMACPLSQFSGILDANALARKAGAYFQLPLEPFIRIFEIDTSFVRTPETSFSYGPQLLNRKFKIAFGALHKDPVTGKIIPDNCAECLTNDLAVIPILENNQVKRFQIYIGGGQGERNGKPTTAALAKPLGIVTEEQLFPAMDAVVKVHQEWGDRQNRHWARIKYVVKKLGIEWFRERVHERVSFKMAEPDPDLDYGARHLHHGWMEVPGKDLLCYGMFIENGRVSDGNPNGKVKTMVRELVKKYPVKLMITPNQDLIFTDLPKNMKAAFEADLERLGHGQRNGKPFSRLRLESGACVGLDTCRLSYTESEKYEPILIDELEKLGWGELATSIGVTGCERQCFRPATKAIGLIGSGLNRFQLKLMGTEDCRHQGVPVISQEAQKMYLRSIPRERIPGLLDTLFKFYQKNRQGNETVGYFNRRIGMSAIINHLKENPATADLMVQSANLDGVIE